MNTLAPGTHSWVYGFLTMALGRAVPQTLKHPQSTSSRILFPPGITFPWESYIFLGRSLQCSWIFNSSNFPSSCWTFTTKKLFLPLYKPSSVLHSIHHQGKKSKTLSPRRQSHLPELSLGCPDLPPRSSSQNHSGLFLGPSPLVKW